MPPATEPPARLLAAAEGRGATLRTLLTLAWPIVVSRSTQVVVGLSDALMTAHLGPAGLAATTAGAMNAYCLFILPMGIVLVVASFSSQLAGKGDPAGARRYGWYGLAVAGATAIVSLAAVSAIPAALARFSYAPDVRALLADYLALRLLGVGAAVGLETFTSYYGGLGNTRLPMRANVAAMVLNVALNWVLIDGHLGAPGLGVRGAALASTLSTAIAFLGLFAVFAASGRRAARPRAPLALAELGRLLRFGVPSGLNWFFEFLAFSFFMNVVVAGLGTTSIAALMSVLQVNATAFMPAFGVASAGAILVGQAIGAGRKDDAPRTVALTFAVAGTWQALAGLAYLAAPDLILAPFAREPASREAFLDAARGMLLVSAAWQLFDAAAGTLGEALRAAGDTAFVLWVRVAIGWGLFAPASWIAVRVLGGGDVAAAACLVIYLGALAVALLLRFRSGAWRRIELVPGLPA